MKPVTSWILAFATLGLVLFVASLHDNNLGNTEKVDVQVVDTIEKRLEGKTSTEKANIKGDAIALLGKQARETVTFADVTYDIEIVGTQKVEGGVAVFARVWNQDGTQIGFGADGSVDIERFIIINPPILVDDPNGKITRIISPEIPATATSTATPAVTRTLTENPKLAILQTLVHTIKVSGQKHSSEKIIPEKIGNTVSTFYPSAGAASPVDGYAFRSNAGDGTWATARAAAGSAASDTASILVAQSDKQVGENYIIYRSPSLFDTSSIPDTDSITSATLSYYITVVQDGDNDAITVTPVTLASNAAVAASDYNIASWSDTQQVTALDMTGLTTSAYNDMTVNATGLSNISKTGITSWGLRAQKDVTSTAPTEGVAISVQASAADVGGTTQDPKLVVTHSASATFAPWQMFPF